MGIILTEKAAKEVKRLIVAEDIFDGNDNFLRVGVDGGGCSGFSYSLSIANDFDKTQDGKSIQHDVTVVVDRKSALYLDGTTVDFYQDIDKYGFTFDNPNAVKSCGCGSSFQA